ncbi:MAG: efflux transporter outer membrane subunit [Brachymonas sp.]|nr:efflux transporter outer membrane subunit [Brachymonas sp.]
MMTSVPVVSAAPVAVQRPALRVALAAALATALAGCSLTPTYDRPVAPVTPHWPAAVQQAQGAGKAAVDVPWQEFVLDPRLREIIALTLHNNRDLRIAVKNIEQARAQHGITAANMGPTVGGTLGGSRSSPNPSPVPGAPSVASTYSVGLGVSAWEIDFFGRLRALNENALARYLATEEARKATQISLISAVASTWLSLQANGELQALAERTLGTRQQSTSLTRLRMDAGVASALDMRQAESLAASARAAVAQQQRLRTQDINALTLLVGQEIPEELLPPVPPVVVPRPGNDATKSIAVPPMPNTLSRFAEIGAGLPSDVLLRRPDILAAEQQLVAANANIGAARAAFFPRVTLTGAFGRASTGLEELFGGPAFSTWSFLPQISVPIFDWGRNQANLNAAKAGRDIAVAQYEKAIQTGFREVADALAGRATLTDQLAALEAQAAASREAYRLSELRYRNGIASYLHLLDAQRALYASEQALVGTRLQERVNQVNLYKALGGGWTEPAPAAAPANASD